MIAKCRHCHREHHSVFASTTCCLFAPKEPTGWCAWCGRDCPGTFCSRPCAVAFRDDVLADCETPPARGWCAWCGRDCKKLFCNRVCEVAYGKDASKNRAA